MFDRVPIIVMRNNPNMKISLLIQNRENGYRFLKPINFQAIFSYRWEQLSSVAPTGKPEDEKLYVTVIML